MATLMYLIPTLSLMPLFVNLETESVAVHQSVVVPNVLHKVTVMRRVARAPAFIQRESEDKLTGVESDTGLWCKRIVLYGS